MAIDTKTERLALINFGTPWRKTLPNPTGLLSLWDRYHLLNLHGMGAGVPIWSIAAMGRYLAGAAAHDYYLAGAAATDTYLAGAAAAEGGTGG